MNPLFVKVGLGIGIGVIFSAAALLILLLGRPEQQGSYSYSSNYTGDDPTTVYVCCICLEDIDCTADKKKVFILSCKHKFHRQCLRQLFQNQGSSTKNCPYCRRRIDDSVVSAVLK